MGQDKSTADRDTGMAGSGATYVYTVDGTGKKAAGTFELTASHDGQQYRPWLPGRTWEAGITERPDSYFSDAVPTDPAKLGAGSK